MAAAAELRAARKFEDGRFMNRPYKSYTCGISSSKQTRPQTTGDQWSPLQVACLWYTTTQTNTSSKQAERATNVRPYNPHTPLLNIVILRRFSPQDDSMHYAAHPSAFSSRRRWPPNRRSDVVIAPEQIIAVFEVYPPHQSPSVIASPQGKARAACCPSCIRALRRDDSSYTHCMAGDHRSPLRFHCEGHLVHKGRS